jgi:hypothetical protein
VIVLCPRRLAVAVSRGVEHSARATAGPSKRVVRVPQLRCVCKSHQKLDADALLPELLSRMLRSLQGVGLCWDDGEGRGGKLGTRSRMR